MNKPETVTEAKVAMLFRAAEAHLEHQRATAGAIQMSGTNPPRFVAIGTAAEIAQLLREDDEPATTASHPARRQRRGDRPKERLTGWPEEFGASAEVAAGSAETRMDTGFDGGAESILATPAATSGDAPTDLTMYQAQSEFSDYFSKNYPMDTIITDPDWHSTKIWQAAMSILGRVARIERAAAPSPTCENVQGMNIATGNVQAKPENEHIDAPATASGDELPPLPRHPDPHTMIWTTREADTIRAAQREAYEAGRRAAVSAATKPTAEAFLASELPAAEPVYRVSDIATKPAPLDLSDARIEELFIAAGGKWVEDSFWKIEDADLHPFARYLLATKPAAAPEGWKWVPETINEDMHVAAVRAVVRATGNDDFPPAVWAAMLAAAPQAPTAAPAEQVREVPTGAAVDGSGTIYHNIAEMYHQYSECYALHRWLDDKGVPRADADGKVYSAVGRVSGMAQDAARFRWLNDDHASADVRELARSLAGRLGTSSYFAITRDIDEAMRRSAPDGAQGEGNA